MSFAQFNSQHRVVELLQRSLAQERLAHAYLFTGGDPAELEAMALALAQTLNCLAPPKSSPAGIPLDSCGACRNCQNILASNHPDVHWVRPESKSRVITIDQVRALMDAVHLKPLSATYKTGLIVAADRLNIQAANAFLKTLEEPPPKSILILLTSQPERVLETIFSRCLRLNFGGNTAAQLPPDQLAWLKTFCEASAAGQKTLLNRYRLLGILLARLTQLKAAIEKTLTARSSLEKYPDADSSLAEKWEQELTAAIEAEYRRQRVEVLNCLQSWLRDVWLLSLGIGNQRLYVPELAAITQDVAGRITSDAGLENLRVIEKTQRLLETNVQEALALEVGLLKLQL